MLPVAAERCQSDGLLGHWAGGLAKCAAMT
jgi:hypothetical protein